MFKFGKNKTTDAEKLYLEGKEHSDAKNYNKAAGLLEKARKNSVSEYIFITQFGELRSYQSLRKQFERFLDENGLGENGITFHKFRHTYATLLMEEGVNPRVVQELLGHKKVETTLNIYTSVSLPAMEKAAHKLGAALSKLKSSELSESEAQHRLIVVNE